MEIRKRIKNKKIMIIVLLSLVLISVIGTTFALFTDVINLTQQNFTSGTLDLVETTAVALTFPTGMVAGDPIAPGDIFGFTGLVTNEGDLDAKVRVQIEETDDVGDPIAATGDWAITIPSTVPAVLAGGADLNMATSGIQLEYLRTNVNDVQDTPYYFIITIQAMQDRNTVDTELDNWDQVVTTPFTLTPP